MNVDYVNPFIEATVSVFDTMLGSHASRTGLELSETFTPVYEVTGIIGLSGKASGDVIISFEKRLAIAATQALLGESVEELNEEVLDAVGEITNMIAGKAKSSLQEYNMTMALPTVIVGKNHTIHFPRTVKPIAISFSSEMGDFNIKVGLVENTAEGGKSIEQSETTLA